MSEDESKEMELTLIAVSGRQIKMPGKKAINSLLQQEPKPPLVTIVNIVIKYLDSVKFPILSRYTNQMLLDLQRDKVLNDVIGHNIKGRIREFKFDKAINEINWTKN